MAAIVSLSTSLELKSCSTIFFKPNHSIFSLKHTHPCLIFPRSTNTIYKFNLSVSTSGSSPSNSPSTPLNPILPGRFLTNVELEKLKSLEEFEYLHELESGSLCVRVMREEEMEMAVALLSESFAESMLLPKAYVKLLGFLVKQYLMERGALMPHAATLVGFYRGKEDDDFQLAGTVEVSFNKMGANPSLPTPSPPKESPYVCNMSVKDSLRKRGIGWHILKAGEELISKMSSSREVYLHCRLIDEIPFNMYKKAGYDVVRTDSFFVLLTLQRRKNLMRKLLPLPVIPDSDEDEDALNGSEDALNGSEPA
ncbi:uncharacterized protein LOC124922046 [Impatiens glandulifera]|uniref:uncharacterized protein LOC124922046 n=1 Tax=Impatiens glandulifera TaxID=253017 RepID=UPI001FB12415|nr:uncharacterized protein LOC124922046 [Impatiens glandulifera]